MRRRIKDIVFFFYSLVRRDVRPKIVFYHDVGQKWTAMGTPREIFWRQMKMLRTDDRVCFDDGFRGVWDERDGFADRKIRPTLFVAPRLVGQKGYLTWDELRILSADFGFSIQSHTWSHQTLVGSMIDESPSEERTEEWYRRELAESREKIAREVGCDVTELCFPVGYYNDALISRCRAAGYQKVYTCIPANRTEGFVQGRCLVQDIGVLAFGLFFAAGCK